MLNANNVRFGFNAGKAKGIIRENFIYGSKVDQRFYKGNIYKQVKYYNNEKKDGV